MTDRELLEMALEALEEVCNANILGLEFKPQYHQLITALRTALSRKALDELAEIDRELGLDYMRPDLAKVGEVGVWGEQEPVAWQERQAKRMKDGVVTEWSGWYPCRYRTIVEAKMEVCGHIPYEWRPLYTHPPRREWQGLTDDDLSVCDEDGVLLARYWEAKLKEKNT
jgi:hypothetical protein